MEVRYNPVLAGILLALAAVDLVAGVLAANQLVMLSSVLIGAGGFVYLTRTWFVVEAGEICVKSPIGPMVRRFPGDPSSFVVDGSRLVTRHGGRVIARRWLAHPDDWDALSRRLPRREAASDEATAAK